MTKLPSYSLLRVICFQILAVTTATSCRPGEKGKWVFHGSDGFQIEQKCRLCTPSVPWLSHIPTNATGTLQLILASGQMIGEYQMSNGVKHGHSRFWNATGQPIMDACYLLESGEFSSSSWFVRTHFPLSADRLIATVP